MKYTVRTRRSQPIRRMLAFKLESQPVEYDFRPWAADNGDVTGVVWLVVNGSVQVSGETLVGNVATAQITYNEIVGSLIKITATTAGDDYITYLDVYVKDPPRTTSVCGKRVLDDYGLCG